MTQLFRLLLAASLLPLLLGGCRGKSAEPELPPLRRVFLVTVDTLRADHLSLYGYPRATSPDLDRLAATGTVFDRAIAQWPKTGPSFASMFTGRYPQSTGLTYRAALTIPASYLTLPEFFQQAGYKTVGVVSNAVLAARFGWNTGFDEFAESWGGGEHPEDPEQFRHLLSAPRVNQVALPLLERHAKSDKLFVWLHYSDPHAPYILPDGVANPFLDDRLYTGDAKIDLRQAEVVKGKKLGDHEDLKHYVAQYDANVLVADRAIRAALDRARELGLLDDALIVFTADHGESLGEHGLYFEHGPLPYNTTSHVPLFFVDTRKGAKIPAGQRIGRPVELVDLYPTLRDLVAPGRTVEGLEGKSLLPFFADRPDEAAVEPFRRAFSEAGGRWNQAYFTSVQEERWKLVYRRPGRKAANQAVQYELYDLAADPLETRDLAAGQLDQARRLRRELLGWMKSTAGQDLQQGTESEEQNKALKALGYAN